MTENPGEKKSEGKLKILAVDDEIGIISFLYDFFTQKGYRVLQASTHEKAIQLVKREDPAVVLLDIKLGRGKNGIDTLKDIKQISPRMKVIMMTGVTDKEIAQEAFRLGADDYITKPISLFYLEKVVLLKMLNLEIERLGSIGSKIEPKKNI